MAESKEAAAVKPAAKKKATKTTKTPKADTKTKALAVAKPKVDVTSLFANLDVAALNQAVDDISNRTGKITPDEKKNAICVIDKWEKGVVEQIRSERRKIETFCNYVESFSTSFEYMVDNVEYIEPLRQLIENAGLSKKLPAIAAARSEYNLLKEELNGFRDIGPESTITMTEDEQFKKQQAYERDLFIKQNEINKANRKYKKLVSELSLELNRNKGVKLAISKLRSAANTLLKNESVCATKANTAKLAVSIDDEKLREKLKALTLISLI